MASSRWPNGNVVPGVGGRVLREANAILFSPVLRALCEWLEKISKEIVCRRSGSYSFLFLRFFFFCFQLFLHSLFGGVGVPLFSFSVFRFARHVRYNSQAAQIVRISAAVYTRKST